MSLGWVSVTLDSNFISLLDFFFAQTLRPIFSLVKASFRFKSCLTSWQ